MDFNTDNIIRPEHSKIPIDFDLESNFTKWDIEECRQQIMALRQFIIRGMNRKEVEEQGY